MQSPVPVILRREIRIRIPNAHDHVPLRALSNMLREISSGRGAHVGSLPFLSDYNAR
jgi:hypothetical protein